MRKSQTISVPSLPDLMRRGCEAAYAKCGFGKLGDGLVEYAMKNPFSSKVMQLMDILRSDTGDRFTRQRALSEIDDPNAIVALNNEHRLYDLTAYVGFKLVEMLGAGKLDDNEEALWLLISIINKNHSNAHIALSKSRDIRRMLASFTRHSPSSWGQAIADRLCELPDAMENPDARMHIVLFTRNKEAAKAAIGKMDHDQLVVFVSGSSNFSGSSSSRNRTLEHSPSVDLGIFAIDRLGDDTERLLQVAVAHDSNHAYANIKIRGHVQSKLLSMVDRIEDQETLRRIALNEPDKDKRLSIIEKINGEEALCDIAYFHGHDSNVTEKLAAMFSEGNITTDRARALLVVSEHSIRSDAYHAMESDPDAFLTVAIYGYDFNDAATEKLSSMLADIPADDAHLSVLKFIATNGINASVRELAFCKIRDSASIKHKRDKDTALISIIEDTKFDDTKVLVLRHFEDKLEEGPIVSNYPVLAAIAKHTISSHFGLIAVDRINDSGYLHGVAKSRYALSEVAEKAVTKMIRSRDCPESFLSDIYESWYTYDDVKCIILEHLENNLGKLEESRSLLIVALNTHDPQKQKESMVHICEKYLLSEFNHDFLQLVALHHPDSSVCRRAIGVINNPYVLIKIVKESTKPQIALAALDKIGSKLQAWGHYLEGVVSYDHPNKSNSAIMEKAKQYHTQYRRLYPNPD